MNAACAASAVRLPAAEIQCVPGNADTGTWPATGPKLAGAELAASATSVLSKYTSTSSEAPNPAPDTLTVVVGGPTDGESNNPGLTVNEPELVPVPPEVVTEIGPLAADAGTVAASVASELTADTEPAPLNLTAVAPVNPEPLTETGVPIDPETGVNDVIPKTAATPQTRIRRMPPPPRSRPATRREQHDDDHSRPANGER